MNIRTLLSIALVATFSRGVSADEILLNSVMNGTGRMSEAAVTDVFFQIERDFISSGSVVPDVDGAFLNTNDTQVGSGIDLFPNEANFIFGNISFDESTVTGIGIETTAITAVDLSAFWTLGSATTDISDTGLKRWLFELPSSISFGSLDTSDTATFTNGTLTSIDLNLPTTVSLDLTLFGGALNEYVGDLSISGNAISYQIDNTQNGSRFVADLTGTVNAVSAVPEPSSLVLLGLMGTALVSRRKRS